MNDVYFVEAQNPSFELNCRTSSYHATIFHGVGRYPQTFSLGIAPPSTTNSNRESLHVRRSGRFVPPVWKPDENLIISAAVLDELNAFGLEVTPVVFETLVDVPLPDLGNFSWYEQEDYPFGLDPEFLDNLPADPSLRSNCGEHFEILSANLYERPGLVAKAETACAHFGTYTTRPPKDVLVSEELLKMYPVVWAGVLQVRDDVFAAIAPHLELDYFDLARLTIQHGSGGTP